MSDADNLTLSPYYLNTRRLSEITGVEIPIIAQRSLNENSGERAQAMRFASGIARELLKSGSIPSLIRAFAASDTEDTPFVASLWAVFTFRDVAGALAGERKGKTKKPGTFTANMQLGDTEFEIAGELSNDHLYSETAPGILSKRRRMLVVGRFELRDKVFEAQPYIIGDMVKDLGSGMQMSWSQSVRAYPEIISTFTKMKDVNASTATDLKTLLDTPEDDVKHAFATIIGEPFVPKDWGGEKSDLQTSRVRIDDRPVSAAFIFKGPAVKGEMHPNNMGKRGDQLVRAFDEPVDLVVVQHCNKIANSVVRIAEALAVDPKRPRRYCIIDGEDTVRILKAYGLFPPPGAPSAP